MRAMIMAAGLGTRLMPLTARLPKPMVPILGRPALGRILDLLRRHGVVEVVVNLHHFPDSIRDRFGDGSGEGTTITYSVEEELLGTAGGVKNNQAFLEGGTFLVMSGDSLTDIDLTELVAAHREAGGIATLAVKPVDDTTEYGVVILDAERRVLGFQEKPRPEEALSDLCNCGIYVFEPAIFDHIPAGSFYDFGRQVFHDLLDKGVAFHAHTVSGYWSDVGGLDAYREGNFDALTGKVRVEGLEGGLAGGDRIPETSAVHPAARIEGPVFLGEGCAVGEAATIVGPAVLGAGTVLGAGCRVAGSVLWDGCRLDDGSVVEGSLLAGEVCVERGSRVAEAVLGEGCRVAAGRAVAGVVVEPGAVAGV